MRHLIFDPAPELSRLQSDMNRMMARMFDGDAMGTDDAPARWTPALDVSEDDDAYLISADLPGVDEDDITVELDDDRLRIAGTRQHAETTRGNGWHRSERSFGRFERRLLVPEGIDPDSIEAHFDKGVLELRIPKPAELNQEPHRIPIGTGRNQENGAPER